MNDKKKKILTFEDLQYIVPLFQTPWGSQLLKVLIPLVGLERINDLYTNACHKDGAEFVDLILKELGITYTIENRERLMNLPKGAFITVSNHPYGALDGLILIHILASYRTDYKVMVNWILTYISSMSNNFIAVDPISNARHRTISLAGIKQSLSHIRNGHPIGFFPAGAVSKINSHLRIVDREWQPNIIRLIQQMNVPVTPIYFHGHNSLFYNILGILSWKIRSLRLPREVLNKRNKVFRISIGQPISAEIVQQKAKEGVLGAFLKKETYKLKKSGI